VAPLRGSKVVSRYALPATGRALVFCAVAASCLTGTGVASAATQDSAGIEDILAQSLLRGQLALALCLALVAGNVLGVTISAIIRRHYGVELGWPAGELLLHLTAVISGVLTLVFALATLGPLSAHPWEAQLAAWAPALGKAAVASTIIVAGNVVMAWISPERGLLAKLKETAVLCSLVWLLAHALGADGISLASVIH
jgi:hypothetical protein